MTCVVDDARRLAMPEPAQDPAHDHLVARAIHARDAEPDRVDALVAGQLAGELLDQVVEDLLDLQLSVGLQVRAGRAAPRPTPVPVLVREQSDRLGSAGVDARGRAATTPRRRPRCRAGCGTFR
jgi:hypothetical protein